MPLIQTKDDTCSESGAIELNTSVSTNNSTGRRKAGLNMPLLHKNAGNGMKATVRVFLVYNSILFYVNDSIHCMILYLLKKNRIGKTNEVTKEYKLHQIVNCIIILNLLLSHLITPPTILYHYYMRSQMLQLYRYVVAQFVQQRYCNSHTSLTAVSTYGMNDL